MLAYSPQSCHCFALRSCRTFAFQDSQCRTNILPASAPLQRLPVFKFSIDWPVSFGELRLGWQENRSLKNHSRLRLCQNTRWDPLPLFRTPSFACERSQSSNGFRLFHSCLAAFARRAGAGISDPTVATSLRGCDVDPRITRNSAQQRERQFISAATACSSVGLPDPVSRILPEKPWRAPRFAHWLESTALALFLSA